MVEHETVESELQRVTAEIWRMTCEAEVDPLIALPSAAEQRETLAGITEISGAWNGAVAVQVTLPAARQVAACMFCLGAGEEPSREQVEDALKEISNMTGGNLKTVLPEECRLAIPTAVLCGSFSLDLPGREVLCELPFSAWNQPFVVRVFKVKRG